MKNVHAFLIAQRVAFLSISMLFIIAWNNNENKILFTSGHKVIGFDITQVKLLKGPFSDAQERDRKYLLTLRPERLLTYFRTTAGLDSLYPAYKGWEDRELRGHFAGHYLSACAMMYAATGDIELKNKTETLVAGLKECQQKNKDGYISAFPRSFINRVEKNEKVWAPYYTIHKILAGLLDVHTYCSNNSALEIAKGMADWIDKRCAALSRQQMQNMLDSTEQGGMNEVLYNLYEKTRMIKYLDLARKFYQESYFRPLSHNIDSLQGQHSNSFIPNVVGLARDYELTGDVVNKGIVQFFWRQVTKTRSFVTGGTSNGEHWGSQPNQVGSELGPSSHETCCTYNMLKLTRHLFTWQPNADYAEYYERALWNGILPTQHPKTGMTMYYVPMASGYYKTFSTAETSFWCCTGSGVENFAKTGNSIYFGKGDTLFVNQFIASTLSLPEQGFILKQETEFPLKQETTFLLHLKQPSQATIMLRIPDWLTKEYSITVNGKKIPFTANNGYAAIKRLWKNNDKVLFKLPMQLHTDILPGSDKKVALLYGPLVLAGVLGDSGLTTKKQYGQYGPYNDKPVTVPVLKGNSKQLTGWISPVKDIPLTFSVSTVKGDPLLYIPFYLLFDQRYMIYAKIEENDDYRNKK